MSAHARTRAALALACVAFAACARGEVTPDAGGAGDTTAAAALPPAPPIGAAERAFVDTLQERTFRWFWETTNAKNGLTPDRWPTKSFSSVAAIGFALAAYPIGVEHQWVTRGQAAERTLTTLRFLWRAPQGPGATGVTGHKGFFYHFLDMETGLRFQQVELSTIDTSLLLAGALACQAYFDGPAAAEGEIRALVDSLYFRIDWPWAMARPPLVSMGWHPERGFIASDWGGYNEGMVLYALALGSPTHPIDSTAWSKWTSGYDWGTFHGQAHVGFAPLFGHQYSQMFIDFRGIRDEYMRGKGGGIDYFENSRRATLAQRAYAVANPLKWKGYGANLWGLTAVDGPKDTTITYEGSPRTFWTYSARGASFNEVRDDGTLAPTAAGGSIPFAPEETIAALMEMRRRYGDHLFQQYGFLDSFNPSFTWDVKVQHGKVVPGVGWFDGDYLGIDQGPIVIQIENWRNGFVWELFKKNPHIRRGLQRAGFTGGWLEAAESRR